MISPTAVDLVKCIEANLIEKVRPHVTDASALSALATILPMLRHVAVRIADEGQILTDDIGDLQSLLGDAIEYLRSCTDEEAAVLRSRTEDARAKSIGVGAGYENLVVLAERAGGLREALQHVIRYLHDQARKGSVDAGHESLRASVRRYLARQIDAESRLIEPAFMGRGPRR